MTRCFGVLLILAGMAGVAAAEDPAVKVGDLAPDFEVMGVDGKTFRLSEKLGENQQHVVLIFSRAAW